MPSGNPNRSANIWIAAFFGVAILGALSSLVPEAPRESPKPPEQPAVAARPAICDRQPLEVFAPLIYRLDSATKTAYVTELWERYAFDQRKGFASYMYECHGVTRISDYKTEKSLGGYGALGPYAND